MKISTGALIYINRLLCHCPHQIMGVLRDHEFLIGRDDPERDRGLLRADTWAAGRIRALVKARTEPRGLLAHSAPNFGGVLTDARRKDQSVQAAESGGERSQLSTDPVDKQSDGVGRVRVIARQQGSHVIADAGNAEEPRGMIQQVGYRTRRHTFFLYQVENDRSEERRVG